MLGGLLPAYPLERMRRTDSGVQLAMKMRGPTQTAVGSPQLSIECIMFVRRIGTYYYEDLIAGMNPPLI